MMIAGGRGYEGTKYQWEKYDEGKIKMNEINNHKTKKKKTYSDSSLLCCAFLMKRREKPAEVLPMNFLQLPTGEKVLSSLLSMPCIQKLFVISLFIFMLSIPEFDERTTPLNIYLLEHMYKMPHFMH